MLRYRLLFKGIVQGVGFRPFIYREAIRFGLNGFVRNTTSGVVVEIEGDRCDEFLSYVEGNPPVLAVIESVTKDELECFGHREFKIIESDQDAAPGDLLIPPDIALCGLCRAELFDDRNPRFNYPFINCTDCGPRFTIIESIPYDRPATTMKSFPMCDYCRSEYIDPANRRYHAQPVACPSCGPTVVLMALSGEQFRDPMKEAAAKLLGGKILAIKGLGGYHLAGAADSPSVIDRIRQIKNRGNKPFALMGTLNMIKKYCFLDPEEESFLSGPGAPILLLRKRPSALHDLIAPGHNRIGFMLPYTPVHELLLGLTGIPLVMTSANHSDEPIIYRDEYRKLFEICDFILTNNRDIHMFTDDSVAAVFRKKLYLFRRSRGFVPLPVKVPSQTGHTVLGLGAYMKTTSTFLYRGRALMSQYIGTTGSCSTLAAQRMTLQHFQKVFSLTPDIVAVDMHPGYPGRTIAQDYPGARVIEIQHHKAHIASVMAENGCSEKVIGIAMDGTGYGEDGQVWGGEFFIGDYSGFSRYGHLRYLFLPAGDKSVMEPWRFALSLLCEMGLERRKLEAFSAPYGKSGEIQLKAIDKKIGGIQTSSCGRFFDAVSVLCGAGEVNTYDGELPALLQALAERSEITDESFEYSIYESNKMQILDLVPAAYGIITSNHQHERKAAAFHNTVAKALTEMAVIGRERSGVRKAALSGGVFQNLLLLEQTVSRLESEGFEVLVHNQIPANDSGISLGQAILAAHAAL